MVLLKPEDTIYAPATPSGTSAIAVVRISGEEAVSICEKIFKPASSKVKLKEIKSHTALFGSLISGNELLDEVVVTIFRSPQTYTGEDLIEISCHGSPYIVAKLCELLSSTGIRLANPGEFTLRAFLNGKLDLSQAEAVADLINSNSKASHDLALHQMRGGFSSTIKELRAQLLDFSSLIELELDFSEEDVEFANRDKLNSLLEKIQSQLEYLISSFSVGNVLKAGIPVAIAGKPNAGKSTLLNVILNEEKAIVSDVPGTTRDAIEDTIIIDGIAFRFIDTAGLRESKDIVENEGIVRTWEKISQAKIIIYVADMTCETLEDIKLSLEELKNFKDNGNKKFIIAGNKADLLSETPHGFSELTEMGIIYISAKRKENINLLTGKLSEIIQLENINDNIVVSNARHHEALSRTLEAVKNIKISLVNNLPTDLIATDIRQALHYLGEITGQITTEEILQNIFGRFCIGK